MQWRKEYDEKRLSPDAAVNLLKDSNNLILGMSVAMPPALILSYITQQEVFSRNT